MVVNRSKERTKQLKGGTEIGKEELAYVVL